MNTEPLNEPARVCGAGCCTREATACPASRIPSPEPRHILCTTALGTTLLISHSQRGPQNAPALAYGTKLRTTGGAPISTVGMDMTYASLGWVWGPLSSPGHADPLHSLPSGPYTSVLGSVSNPSVQMFLPTRPGGNKGTVPPKPSCPLSLYSPVPYFIPGRVLGVLVLSIASILNRSSLPQCPPTLPSPPPNIFSFHGFIFSPQAGSDVPTH